MKTAWTGFHSPLASQIERYLATKRALGCKFDSEDRTLRLLDRFLVEQQVNSLEAITGACLDQFLDSRERDNPRSHNHLLGVVRRLFDWLVGQQVLPASPLRANPRRETKRYLPFLFEPPVIRQLLEEAGQLPDNPRSRLRGSAYASTPVAVRRSRERILPACGRTRPSSSAIVTALTRSSPDWR